MRRIVHVDMDAFFAAIEQERHPELAGRPVVIGGHGDPTERGVVSTESYEARRYGLRSGMPLRTAYRLCPNAVYLPVDFDTYAEVSTRSSRSCTSSARVLGGPRGQRSGRSLPRRLGPQGTLRKHCSVGIGPNKLLAKLASDMEKPDGLTVLAEADIEPRVWPLPVRKLLGVGPRTAARLAALGVTTIGALAAIPRSELQLHFGDAHGRYLHDAAHGVDESPLITTWEPRSIGRQVTFQKDINDGRALTKALNKLVETVVADACEQRCRARTVTVRLRFADFETLTRQTTLPRPTNALATIKRAAHRSLERIALRKKVRLIGVRLSGPDSLNP